MPGKSPEAVEFTVTRGLVIGGVLTDPQGQPRSGAEVFPVRNEAEGPPQPRPRATRRADSSCRAFRPSDPQQLLAVHPQKKLIASAEVEAGQDAATRTVSLKIQLQAASSAAGL